ncbi:MAG: hypothetical protein KDJ25_07065 [Rhodoblastus sp.]|nr:hypothetical protein [Rhodoblastus sp.]
MPKVPFNLNQDFRKYDPSMEPPLAMTVRDDQARAFRIVGLALLVVFCSALSVVLTSGFGPLR